MNKEQRKRKLRLLKQHQAEIRARREAAMLKLPPHDKGEFMHLKRYDPAPGTEARDYFIFRDKGIVPSYLTLNERRRISRQLFWEECFSKVHHCVQQVFPHLHKKEESLSQYSFLMLGSVYTHKHTRCLDHVAKLYSTTGMLQILKVSYHEDQLPNVIRIFSEGPCLSVTRSKLKGCLKRLQQEQRQRE